MKPFAFRQRVGNINWKLISSLDYELVIDENQIEELQSLVDDVTFCEIKSNDIRGSTIQDLKKLMNIMQLMLEYLLYCQESQLQLVRELHKKNKGLKQMNKELTEQYESSKEDIRIYKRQIASLKTSIEKYKEMVLKTEGFVAVAPRVFNPLEPEGKDNQESKNNSTIQQLGPLVESMLRHERQTRDFVKEMMDDQRATLLRELDRLSTRSDHDSNNLSLFESKFNLYLDRMAQKMEQIAINSAKTALTLSPPVRAPSPSPPSQPIISREEIEKILIDKHENELKLRDIMTREKRLADKERDNQEREREKERDYQEKLYELDMKAKALEKQRFFLQKLREEESSSSSFPVSFPQVRTVGINTAADDSQSPEEFYRRGVALASRLLANRITSGSTKGLQSAFTKWKSKMLSYAFKLNKSLLKQQDDSTIEIIQLREALEKMRREKEREEKNTRQELNRLKQTNQRLEETIQELNSKSSGPKPNEIKVEIPPVKRKYMGPSEAQLMADALLRIQATVGTIDDEEALMDDLADELLDRVQIRDGSESSTR